MSETSRDISVVIVSWNASSLLRKCLGSIEIGAHGAPAEVIVVDNGSTDGAPDMVQKDFPWVRLIRRTSNAGYAAAVNEGIRASKGGFVAIINSDIVLTPGCLETLRQFLEQEAKVGLAGPRLLQPDGNLNSTCRRFPTLWNNFCSLAGLHRLFPKSEFFATAEMEHFPHDSVRRIEVVAGSFWLVRREALDQVGLMDEGYFMYAEDMDWCRRFWDNGWEVAFCPGAVAYHHHGGSSSAMPVRFHIQQYRAGLRYWRKFHAFPEVLAIRILYISKQLRVIAQGAIQSVCRPSQGSQMVTRIRSAWACLLWLLGLLRTEDDARVAPPR